MAPVCKDLQLPLNCSAFSFLSLDPCIIIANTGNFSTDQLGDLEWFSINLMRDPLTSVLHHDPSHDLNVACGAVQHSHPEVWKRSFLPPSDGTLHNGTLGVTNQTDLECSTPPTPLWGKRINRLQNQHNELHNRRQLQSPQVRTMCRKRAPSRPSFTYDSDHMETVELENVSSEYDSDDMNTLNTSTELSIDRIKSSDEDTDDEVQSLDVNTIRRRCTNMMQLGRTKINLDSNSLSEAEADDEIQSLEVKLVEHCCTNMMPLSHTEVNFDRNPLSEAEDSTISPRHLHCRQSGIDPDFRSRRRPRK